jgi:type II secretory pathway component PulF
MSEERAPVSTGTVIAATALAVVHTGLLLAVAVMLMRTAPALRAQYMDFGVRVPYGTEVVRQVGTAMIDYAWAVGLVGVAFVALDVFVFVMLASQRRTRALAWIWAVAVTIGLLAVEGPICYLLFVPQFKLMEALTR